MVFEAMAAGCYLITTPNTGSIVKDGVHGKVVDPGDPGQLQSAIEHALNNPEEVNAIGLNNAALVAKNFRQSDYKNKVLAVYEKVLADKAC